MNKVIDRGFRSCRFVSTIVKHPVQGLFGSYFLFYLVNCINTFHIILKLNCFCIYLSLTISHFKS